MKSKTILLWASLVALAACAGMIATASTWAQVASSTPAETPKAANVPTTSSDSAPAPTTPVPRAAVQPRMPLGAKSSGKASPTPIYEGEVIGDGFLLSRTQSPDAPVSFHVDVERSDEALRALLARYAETKEEKARAEYRAAMTQVLQQQFDARQKACEEELVPLEAQVKRLRDLIQKRQQARQEIVKSRLDQLVREAEGLGWPAPMGAGSPQGPYGPGGGYPRASSYGTRSMGSLPGAYSVPSAPPGPPPPLDPGATK